LFKRFKGLETPKCPFVNLPEKRSGRWGQGLTAEKMADCVWINPGLERNSNFSNGLRTITFAIVVLLDSGRTKSQKMWFGNPAGTANVGRPSHQ
jgi:hypothetical protein